MIILVVACVGGGIMRMESGTGNIEFSGFELLKRFQVVERGFGIKFCSMHTRYVI